MKRPHREDIEFMLALGAVAILAATTGAAFLYIAAAVLAILFGGLK